MILNEHTSITAQAPHHVQELQNVICLTKGQHYWTIVDRAGTTETN